MSAYVVSQMPFRDPEEAELYRLHIENEIGLVPTLREIEGAPVVVIVVQADNIDEARAMNKILQELDWKERYPQVITSTHLTEVDTPDAQEVAITVQGFTSAKKIPTAKEIQYQLEYRGTEAFKQSQKNYQQGPGGKAAQRRYAKSDQGKTARERYANSEKGKAARAAYQSRRRARMKMAKDAVEAKS